MIKDLAGLMKQAQAMQSKMAEAQSALDELAVDGQSGGGLVTATVDGKGTLKKVKIDKSLLDAEEAEILEDLVVAAYADARVKAEAAAQEKMAELTEGLGLPAGFKLPF